RHAERQAAIDLHLAAARHDIDLDAAADQARRHRRPSIEPLPSAIVGGPPVGGHRVQDWLQIGRRLVLDLDDLAGLQERRADPDPAVVPRAGPAMSRLTFGDEPELALALLSEAQPVG